MNEELEFLLNKVKLEKNEEYLQYGVKEWQFEKELEGEYYFNLRGLTIEIDEEDNPIESDDYYAQIEITTDDKMVGETSLDIDIHGFISYPSHEGPEDYMSKLVSNKIAEIKLLLKNFNVNEIKLKEFQELPEGTLCCFTCNEEKKKCVCARLP